MNEEERDKRMIKLRAEDEEMMLFRHQETFGGLRFLEDVKLEFEEVKEIVDQILRWRLAGDPRGWAHPPLAKINIDPDGLINSPNIPCPICTKEQAINCQPVGVFDIGWQCQK
jgi:hypothetical protein